MFVPPCTPALSLFSPERTRATMAGQLQQPNHVFPLAPLIPMLVYSIKPDEQERLSRCGSGIAQRCVAAPGCAGNR
jgi:hypothetical protein